VIDNKLAWVGSVNGSVNSTTKNREFGIIFKTKKSVKKLVKIMDEDFNHPFSTTWEKSLACEKPVVPSDEEAAEEN
jgi:phosphatidylserine/phosphatidylglycerophosphate/cardiolipin synthase-like enzyme